MKLNTYNIPIDYCLIFLHHPRTAGSTIYKILQEENNNELIHQYRWLGLGGREFSADPSAFAGWVPNIPTGDLNKVGWITPGHLPFGLHEHIKRPYVYMTLFREPVDKIISEYYNNIKLKSGSGWYPWASKMSLKDYVINGCDGYNWHIENGQVKLTAAKLEVPYGTAGKELLEEAKKIIKEHIFIIGIQDLFDESIVFMSKVFGWKSPFYTRQHIGGNHPPKDKLPQETIATILRYNQLDAELYDYAVDLFNQAAEGLGTDFRDEVKTYKATNKKIEEKLNLGINLFRNASHDAQNIFNEILTIYPTCSEAHYFLGAIALKENELECANSHFGKVSHLDNQNADIVWTFPDTLQRLSKLPSSSLKAKNQKTIHALYPSLENAFLQRKRPLVSVLTLSKNNGKIISRCIESIVKQDYPSIELVIQDRQSTDETLTIVEKYASSYPFIKLYSESDKDAGEAFLQGLRHCTGDIITLCRSDEELMPGTVSWGVEKLALHPELAAIYGDVLYDGIEENDMATNPYENILTWNLESFLCGELRPNYCGSFFRTSALRMAGIFEDYAHGEDCKMYIYYGKVGIKFKIRYFPEKVAKSSGASQQLSGTQKVLDSRINKFMRSFDHVSVASEAFDINNVTCFLLSPYFLPEMANLIKALRCRAYAGFHLMMISSLLSNANAFEDAKTMLKRALSYEPDINFLSKVVIDACNYLNDKCLSNELLEFTDIIIKSALTFPNLHYVRAVALSDLRRYKEAIESIRNEQVLQPMQAGLPGLLFKLQLHILLENQYIRDVLNKGILAKYQLREIANILNNLLTTTETEGVYHFLRGMSSTALASLEDIVNTCFLIASREGTQELINRLKTLAATIVAVKDMEDKTLENKYGS
ncbi:MAG TPA: glycosyltransferase [Candidatus Brocadiaceae bacterium]